MISQNQLQYKCNKKSPTNIKSQTFAFSYFSSQHNRQKLDDFVGHAFGYSTQSLMLLSAVFDPLDLISTVCCSQIGPKKTTLIQDKGKLFKQHRPFPSYFHFFKDLCFFSWQLGQVWLFKNAKCSFL